MSDRISGFSGSGDSSGGGDYGSANLGTPPQYHARDLRVTLSWIKPDIDKPIINGMSLLHLAIGHHDTDLVQELIKRGAKFYPDDKGRMPSLLASLVGAGSFLRDLVNDAEAKALGISSEDC
ncbi:ankyrin repeat domain-containing protein [Roseicella sp. DB1501]|uniref:ankyrin repeat domain-containing protein n=1 Tax=Roseicella sp. DB1501 TaxID=2730925 RepID=UPI0014923945|nr:ankyrin repeat domain-containing protein [Roseicella sp. DB1501]NOG70469.1 ankyrin repeat domain-containing protein [Roseicella sp. DB1501]